MTTYKMANRNPFSNNHYHDFLLIQLQARTKDIILSSVNTEGPIYDSHRGILEFLSILELILTHKLNHPQIDHPSSPPSQSSHHARAPYSSLPHSSTSSRSFRETPANNHPVWELVQSIPVRSGRHTIFLADSVRQLSEVKTDIGRFRAWVRQALNRNVLLECFEALTANKTYIQRWYGPGGLLLNEETCLSIHSILMGISCVHFLLTINDSCLDLTPAVLRLLTEDYFLNCNNIDVETSTSPLSSPSSSSSQPVLQHELIEQQAHDDDCVVEDTPSFEPIIPWVPDSTEELDEEESGDDEDEEDEDVLHMPPDDASETDEKASDTSESYQSALSWSSSILSPPMSPPAPQDPHLVHERTLTTTIKMLRDMDAISSPGHTWEGPHRGLWDSQLETGAIYEEEDTSSDNHQSRHHHLHPHPAMAYAAKPADDDGFSFLEEDHEDSQPSLPQAPAAPSRWLTDDATDRCMACSTRFSFMLRRHHCRGCGRLFCGSCTSQRATMVEHAYKPVRVCNPCYTNLMAGLTH
eukprot:TRINITY_DN4699_c0_g1_i2.p1 TRINITY_DN4699_c0_g1~~TRINITY_DN4699_c0_g1_i2.p1  ORF type:complete len:556 (+),score=119.84 TRINITY_DN4699_c0_g1_i2:96-1670(+)